VIRHKWKAVTVRQRIRSDAAVYLGQSGLCLAEHNPDWRKKIAEAVLLTCLMLAGAA
jgi:hypothetical protein